MTDTLCWQPASR